MRFRDLSIGAANKAVLPDNLDKKEFNQSCWHIQEMFLAFLPNDYVLDGTAKTNIHCGSDGLNKKYMNYDDVNIYYVEDFDFASYANAGRHERELIILETLKEALLDIADKYNSDPSPILHAIDEVRNFDFRLAMEKKLSRSTKSRKFRLQVIREVKYGGEDWYIEFCNSKREFLEKILIAENTNFLESSYQYRKSKWENQDFVILDHIGEESFRFDTAYLTEKYGVV